MTLRTIGGFLVLSASLVGAALGAPFERDTGWYNGRGVEYTGDGSVWYYWQTTKVDESAQQLNTVIPGVGRGRQYIRFRPNGRLAASGFGMAFGTYSAWTMTGSWREVGGVIKAKGTIFYQNGDTGSIRWVQRFKNNKLLVSAAGFDADGMAITSSHTGTELMAVPEPGAAWVLVVGGAMLLGRRRRRAVKSLSE